MASGNRKPELKSRLTTRARSHSQLCFDNPSRATIILYTVNKYSLSSPIGAAMMPEIIDLSTPPQSPKASREKITEASSQLSHTQSLPYPLQYKPNEAQLRPKLESKEPQYTAKESSLLSTAFHSLALLTSRTVTEAQAKAGTAPSLSKATRHLPTATSQNPTESQIKARKVPPPSTPSRPSPTPTPTPTPQKTEEASPLSIASCLSPTTTSQKTTEASPASTSAQPLHAISLEEDGEEDVASFSI